jgi:O-antigen/teichoic acid export membrane protein
VLLQGLSILLLFVRSNVAALQHFRLDGILSVADRFLMIVVCGFLLLWPATAHRFRIEWFVWAQIGCYAAAIAIGMAVLRRIARLPQLLSLHTGSVLAIIRKSAPYALLTFLMAIYMRSDALLVERLCGPEGGEQAGIYASAYRLLDVGNMFSIMFAGILLPLFGRMLAERQDIGPIIRLCVNLLLPVSLLVTVTGWLLGTEIMSLLYHRAGAYDGLVFAWLMTAFPAYSMAYVYSTLLTANGHIPLLNRLAAAGAVFNVGLNCYLIPQYGALGAAVTACCTQWLLAICLIILAARKNRLPWYPRWAATHLAYIAILAATGYGLSRTGWPWPEQGAILVAAGMVLLFIFRFISVRSVKQLLLSR